MTKANQWEDALPDCDQRNLLAGQTALVTGANSGIGKAVAQSLGQAGAKVMVNYLEDESAADDVVKAIESCGVEAACYQADVSDETQVKSMFQEIKNKWGRIDILINNAGLQKDAPFDEMTLEEWNTVLNVNLTGQFLCAREAVKAFKRQGVVKERSCAAGKIICMSSVHDKIPWAGHVNYAASKGGVMLMMKSLAQEVAPYRIRVNSIGPGAVRTPINKAAWETEDAYEALMKLIPYNRIGEPEDIGRAAVWLASDESDYITGTTLYIDGGMTVYPGFAGGG